MTYHKKIFSLAEKKLFKSVADQVRVKRLAATTTTTAVDDMPSMVAEKEPRQAEQSSDYPVTSCLTD